MAEEEILAFVRKSLTTTWDLELLLLLFRTRDRAWRMTELIREIQASQKTIGDAIDRLRALSLLTLDDDGKVRFVNSNPAPADMIEHLQKLCLLKPFAVMSAILEAKNRPLSDFSDAFKLKE